MDYSVGVLPIQLVTLGGLSSAIALASDSGCALIADWARRWLASSSRRTGALGTTGGVMMIGLGGTLALVGNLDRQRGAATVRQVVGPGA